MLRKAKHKTFLVLILIISTGSAVFPQSYIRINQLA
jgi:hypothetical protein